MKMLHVLLLPLLFCASPLFGDEVNQQEELQEIKATLSRLEKLIFLHEPVKPLPQTKKQECTIRHDELERIKTHLCELQNQVDCLEQQASLPYQYGNSCCWSAGVEFLYWTLYESELDYVVSGGPTTLAPLGASGVIGQIKQAEYDWKPGFRVHLGYQFCPDHWMLAGQYTYFYCHGEDTVQKPANELLNGTYHQVVITMGSAESDIAFHYHIGDLLLSRTFAPSPCILAQIQVGGVGAFVEQEWDFTYFQQDGVRFQRFDNDWKFSGGGLKLGAVIDWNFFCGWGLYTEANWSNLVGWYRNHIKDAVFENGAFLASSINARYDQARFVQNFQIKLGPTWAFCFGCFQGHIYALYELNGWFGLQQVNRSFIGTVATEGRGSRNAEGIVGLHGLTLGVNCGF